MVDLFKKLLENQENGQVIDKKEQENTKTKLNTIAKKVLDKVLTNKLGNKFFDSLVTEEKEPLFEKVVEQLIKLCPKNFVNNCKPLTAVGLMWQTYPHLTLYNSSAI
jgi:hypothetical protein